MQQKYCDHGRSIALLTTTWPICRARSSCGSGRKAQEGVDLAVGEQLRPASATAGDPVDVRCRGRGRYERPSRTETDARWSQCRDADSLALEIARCCGCFVAEQFEAADMHAGQNRDRAAALDIDDSRGAKFRPKSTLPLAIASLISALDAPARIGYR